jgi:hypothetical protein
VLLDQGVDWLGTIPLSWLGQDVVQVEVVFSECGTRG